MTTRAAFLILFLAGRGLWAGSFTVSKINSENVEASSCTGCQTSGAGSPGLDPFLELEPSTSPVALNWVKDQNKTTLSILKRDPRYSIAESDAQKILGSSARLPSPELRNGWIYDFWQDSAHTRGIWRRVRLTGYESPNPIWETVLDLNAYARQEGKDWVWKGATCFGPTSSRCLISLSIGGKDAVVVREFDLATRTFVDGGFEVPEGKVEIDWKDKDTLIVGADFGKGSMTDSGYPRTLRLWKRGTPLSEAKVIYEGESTDVEVGVKTYSSSSGDVTVLTRTLTRFTSENWVLTDNGEKNKIAFPRDANFLGIFQKQAIVQLRSDWVTPNAKYLTGSLVSVPLFAGAEASADLVWAPEALTAFNALSFSNNFMTLVFLRDVNSEALEIRRRGNQWKRTKLLMPERGTIAVLTASGFDSRVILSYESFLVPVVQYLADGETGNAPRPIKRLPPQFDTTGLVVEQLHAESLDKTAIPYYLVHRSDIKYDGSNPTLITAYGGFEHSMTPYYWGLGGKLWLEKGGAFVLANIRGGGEFGPKWHEAAQKAHRQRAYDDFEAVSRDVIQRKVTSSRHLGIMGASNGGLLVGVAFTQKPALYNAVICGVPLLDMIRYTQLGAGSSWVGEYGDPADPVMRSVISKYSPYQNVKARVKYPRVFFWTSTADDRVTPSHARKMAARMEAQGHAVLFFENTDGGHSSGATIQAKSQLQALEFVYLYEQLFE